MPPKKKTPAKAAGKPSKIWFGLDNQGVDSNGSALPAIGDWWKSFVQKTQDQKIGASDETAPTEEPNQPETKIPAISNDPIKQWYGVARYYWDKMDASDDGMLDGYAKISEPDIKSSAAFLQPFLDGLPSFNLKTQTNRAIDVGAGIGRIAKSFLSTKFKVVDLLEQNPLFLAKAKDNLTGISVGHFLSAPLQDFEFKEKYDVIWIQWVDLIAFFKRCKAALNPHGIIIVKENVTKEGYFIDAHDNSITRSPTHFKTIFAQAGMRLLKEDVVTDFPPELFPVRMYALL